MDIVFQKAKQQESRDCKQMQIANPLQCIPISRNRPDDILLAYWVEMFPTHLSLENIEIIYINVKPWNWQKGQTASGTCRMNE